jgi:TolA-binding protein
VDHDSARAVFNRVVSEYEGRNAVDNSYNWIAWSFMTDRKYKEARTWYSEIERRFPLTRFRKYADKNLLKIDSIVSNP